jgi:hypothetical protein
MRYIALIQALSHASTIARSIGADDGGRTASLFALASVVEYFSNFRSLALDLMPLQTLMNALGDLETTGARHPMFDAPGTAILPWDRAQFHGAVAAWAHLLGRAAIPQGKADALVAGEVGKLGYRMRGVKQERPKARTIADWRGEANQPEAIGVDRDFYIRTLRICEASPVAQLNEDMRKLLIFMFPHLLRLPK